MLSEAYALFSEAVSILQQVMIVHSLALPAERILLEDNLITGILICLRLLVQCIERLPIVAGKHQDFASTQILSIHFTIMLLVLGARIFGFNLRSSFH